MALTVYHEGRGELRDETRIAIIATTINRTKDKDFPSSVCGVVYQPNQFSWTKKNSPIKEPLALNKAKQLSYRYFNRELNNPIGPRKYFNHKRLGKRFNTPYKPIVLGNLVFY